MTETASVEPVAADLPALQTALAQHQQQMEEADDARRQQQAQLERAEQDRAWEEEQPVAAPVEPPSLDVEIDL
ncbi:hypothetical protein [Kitasatospora sp. HPMI-4]|uniref:hypothetical protein n=1 Tax=Kitasatospora sp. HPMI-4 TaxID=3448443 RepID=UPI003F1D209B